MPLPSALDEGYYTLARAHIMEHLRKHLEPIPSGRILEIGPELRWPQFDTLDIKPGAMFQGDITGRVDIPDSSYDVVLAMEVLEHTTQPFYALAEIRRLLKPGGLLLASAPMNFREHGPLPDCWRFTRHGWRVLMKDWDALDMDVLMTPGRALMPLHINITARCNKMKCIDVRSMAFPMEQT